VQAKANRDWVGRNVFFIMDSGYEFEEQYYSPPEI